MRSSLPSGPVVASSFKVRYAETDAQRVVYHGNYIVWFEVGRTEYCEAAGYPYPRMEAEGIFITVIEVQARYRRSVRYGDTVTVRTRMGEIKSRGVSFHYEVSLPDGSLAAEGETQHLCLDRDGRPIRVPELARVAFAAYQATGLVSPSAS